MNDNVRKVFDILGVEPNEKFKVEGYDGTYYISEKLFVNRSNGIMSDLALGYLLNGDFKIIKLPKQNKKLRDVTPAEYKNWFNNVCGNGIIRCRACIFNNVQCEANSEECWVKHKDLYSDKFLDQEIEVEEYD